LGRRASSCACPCSGFRQLVDRGLLDCVRDSTGRRMIVKASVVKLIEQRMHKKHRAGAR
jgi:hypothetical protein